MKTPTRKETAALSKIDHVAKCEQTRWELWELQSLVDRQRVMGLAGLDKARAVQPLASFTDHERLRIAFAISNHVMRMEFIAKLMVMAGTNMQGYLH